MAFNPFDVFRRNQRILFAILTVFIMIMFTMSFGAGDMIQAIPQWFSGFSQQGKVVAEIDGNKVYEGELGTIQQNRSLANRWMFAAAIRSSQNLEKYVRDKLPQVSTLNRDTLTRFLQDRASPQGSYMSQQIFMMLIQSGQLGPNYQQQVQQQTIAMYNQLLNNLASDDKAEAADKEVAGAALALLNMDQRLSRQGEYFMNLPDRTDRDRMNFLLWRMKADSLGIRFTEKDVDALVASEFLNRLTEADVKAADSQMSNSAYFNPKRLKEALADEFRVRVAQTAVMGPAFTRGGELYQSPYGFYDFYREQTGAGRFGLISIPAVNYLSQVQGEPTAGELQSLFNKHRNDEPNPALERPGFRTPRTLKLGWLEVKGDEPYYLAKAADRIQHAQARVALGMYLAAPFSDSGLAAVTAAVPAAIPDLLLGNQYTTYKSEYETELRTDWFGASAFFPAKPVEAAVMTPATVASLSAFAASALGPIAPTSLSASAMGIAIGADLRARKETIPTSLAFLPILPGEGGLSSALAVVAAQGPITKPLPLASVRSRLTDRLKKEVALIVVKEELKEFQKEMTTLGGGADKNDAVKKAESFAKERGLTLGGSQAFHDVFAIADDPGLAVIKEKAGSAHQARAFLPGEIGARFFYEQTGQNARPQPTTGLFKPEAYPQQSVDAWTGGDSLMLVWRTAETDPHTPRNFTEPGVKEKVVQAWKLGKARELAKKAAEDLLAKWNDIRTKEKLGADSPNLTGNLIQTQFELRSRFPDLEAKSRIQYHELRNVAPIVSTPGMMPGRGDTAQPFSLTSSDEIPYPGQDMAQKLIDTRKEPVSTPVLLVDQPQSTYYVAVLLGKDEPSAERFRNTVFSEIAMRGSTLAPMVNEVHQIDLAIKARDEALALLKAEFGYEKEDAAILDDTKQGE